MWILSIFLMIASPNWAAANCGKIQRSKGEVDVLRVKKEDNSTRIAVRATRDFSLLCNDIVVTGKSSRAKLELKGRGGLVSMGPLARIEIETYKQKDKSTDAQTLKLLYGKVRALVKTEDNADKKKPEKQDTSKSNKDIGYKLRITTPSAVAGVRGTDFFVSHNPNTAITEQATIEGTVEVQRLIPPTPSVTSRPIKIETVEVRSGNQVTVAKADITPPKSEEQKKYESIEEKIEALPPLKVTPIVPQVLDEIRQTSVLVQNDKEFTSKQAIEVLGEPETWTPPPDELPLDLKDLKEEF